MRILTIILSFAVFFTPLVMRASTATELAATISGFQGGGSGSLAATASGNTVTVTGSLSDVSSSLTLNIDAGITVLWKASIATGSAFPASNDLIQVDGSGSFEVTTGGYIAAMEGGDNVTAISIVSSDATVTVSGGTVGAAFFAIYAHYVSEGPAITVSGGVVSSTEGEAIHANGNGYTIAVSGTGIVRAISDNGIAIRAWGDNTMITASGTSKVEALGDKSMAIDAGGNVEVKDDAQVSTTTGMAINAWVEGSSVTVNGGTISVTTGIAIGTAASSTITVSGTSKIEATGDNGTAIGAGSDSNIEVKDEVQVIATGDKGNAIGSDSGSNIKVEDKAQITTTTGMAISAGENSMVTVSGTSKVETTGDNTTAIGTDGNIVIKEDAQVSATGDNGTAIATGGNVEINDNAQVSAISGMTINVWGDSSIITVNGGTVSSVSGEAINNYGENSTTIVSGTGKAVATGDNSGTIVVRGNVVIKDEAQVSAVSNYAINIWGDNSMLKTVTVSGTSKVEATGDNGTAINTEGDVEVSGTSKVEATGDNGKAIQTGGNVKVTDGAQVTATTGIAIANGAGVTISGTSKIEATGDNGKAISAGGDILIKDNAQVVATTGAAISDWNENSVVTISGASQVQATGDNGLAIDANITEITDDAQVSATTGKAINAWGDNAKVTISSGTVSSATTGAVIEAGSQTSLITVCGTGKVEATGDNGTVINTAGNVEIKDNAQVSATTGKAFNLWGNKPTATISGGTVTSASTNNVIEAYNENSTIIVSGTGKLLATGDNGEAIHTAGSVEIRDEAQVTATKGTAINIYIESSKATVSGTAKVETTGDNGSAILAPNIEVKETAQVTATTGTAINGWSENFIVSVSGNSKVEATGENGIAVSAANLEVKDAAQVIATTGQAISNWSNNSTVTISGTSKIEVTGDNGTAIVAGGNIIIQDAAQVIATFGAAINVWGETSTVDLKGGVVFAYGKAISSDVITTVNPDGLTVTGTGVVIAWDQAAGNTSYVHGSSDDIVWLPETATAVWDKNDESFGITYTNGTNTGFIPLDVTVVSSSACDIASIESPAGATITNQVITVSVDNSITSQTISVTTSPYASWKLFSNDACTNEITNKTMTLSEGDNTAYIEVTAEDGTTTKIYTIVVTREEEIFTPVLSVSSASLNFPASGGQQTVSISSNTSWTVKSSNTGVTVSPDSGYGNGTVTVTVEANTASTQQTATITVSGEEVTDQTISVTQDAATPALSVSPASLNFPASGAQKTFAISSNASWTVKSNNPAITVSPASGSNNGTVTVTVGENTATTQQTATITISGTGVTAQTISVTQDAAEETPVVVTDETKPVGSDGKGSIELSLSIPSNATLTGSFEISFPEGMTLDEELTVLSLELSGNFYLSFTYKGNNTWIIDIKANALRSSTASEYRSIMNIAYKVDESVQTGSYDVTIMNLDFVLDDNTPIQEDLLTVPVKVDWNETSIENIHDASFYAYTVNNTLRIESSHKELITIYSLTGTPIYSTKKDVGLIEIPFKSLPNPVFIIKGSMSGTIKVVR